MAHPQTSQYTTQHETLSRPHAISRSRTTSQTRTQTRTQSSPSSSPPYLKASSSSVSRAQSASHNDSSLLPTPSHSVPSSSVSALSSPPILTIPHPHQSLPSAAHSNPASKRHSPHQHQNQSRGPGDHIDVKDQRRGGFNKDCHVLSEDHSGGPSLAHPIPKQMQKEVVPNAEKRSISGPNVTSIVNGFPSNSNSGERTRTASGGYQNVQTGAYGHVQQSYPRLRTVSDGRANAGSSSKDTNIHVTGDPYFKAPAAPSLSNTTRAAIQQPNTHSHSQSGLPTTNQRDGSTSMAGGSSTSSPALPATNRTNGVTAAVSQSANSIQRVPPPSMSEPPVAWTASQSHPPSSSPAIMASPPLTNTPAPPPASTSTANLSTTPTRRPSLASPLPPSPIVPASFPRHRATPAPLNLCAAATPSSAAPLNTSTMATPSPRPRTGSSGAHQSASATSSSWTPSPGQYAARPSSSSGTGHVRPGSSGGGSMSHPDSPSASAMMRRLLSKPAPVTSLFGSSGASGSESESKGRWVHHAPGGSRTSGSESEGVGIIFGRRTGLSGPGLGRAATASAALGSGTGANTPTGISSRIHSGLRRKGSSGSGGSGGAGRKSKRAVFSDEEKGTIPDFEFEFSDVDVGSVGIKSPNMDVRRKGTYSKMDEKSSRDAKDHQDKGKEKEKRTRNVLRRRPSAPANMNSTPSSSSPSSLSKTTPGPVIVPPLPKSPPPPSPSERLPAITPFSPLTLSLTPESRTPTGETTVLSSDTTHLQSPISPKLPVPQNRASSSSKNIHRSKSAAAGPPSPRPETHAPHSRTTSQSQSIGRGAASPSPRRSAFMSMDASAPVALSPSANIAVSISPRRSAFVTHPSSSAGAAKASDIFCAPSACAPGPIKTTPSSGRPGRELVSPRTAATPAASLVEAYKRQEAQKVHAADERKWEQARKELIAKEQGARERELRAVERQRAMMMEERERAIRGRRHSEDAKANMSVNHAGRPVTSSSIGRSRTMAVTHLSVQEQEELRASMFSTHTNASLDSLLRVRTARSGSTDALNAGSGFATIERLAGATAGTRADPVSSRKRPGLVAIPPTNTLRKSDHFDVKPTSPRAFDGVERMPDKTPVGKHRDLDPDREEKERGSPEPYYTVFGGLGVGLGSGRGRPGAPDSVWADVHPSQYAAYWDVPGVLQAREFGVREGRATGKDKERPKESLGRSLSRKVSGHWKKQVGGGVVKDSPGKDDNGEQPKRRLLRAKSSTAALNSRLQDRAGSDVGSEVETEQDHASQQSQILRAEHKADSPLTPSPGGSINGAQTSVGHEKVDKTDKSGGRFWKLMKRISVGGLRDRYKEDSTSAPPPVPALPSDYRSQTLPSGRERLRDEFISPSALHSTMSTNPRSIPRKAPPTTVSVPASPAGPIAHTTSSSPMSLTEVASSKFSTQPYSPRSSTSSIGAHLHGNGSFKSEGAPPLPPLTTTTRHIIPPSEVAATADQHIKNIPGAQTKSTSGKAPARPTVSLPPHAQEFSQDWVIARTPSVELKALPLPPVRRPPAGAVPFSSPLAVVEAGSDSGEKSELAEDEVDRAESPTIPSFSTTDTVNNFKPGRRSIGSSLKSTKSRESPVQLRSRSQPASPTSVHQSFAPPFMGLSPSSSSSSLVSPTPKLPPPRPTRSSHRPLPVSTADPSSLPEIQGVNDPSPPQKREEESSAWNWEPSYSGRKSESAIRDTPSAFGNLRDLPLYTPQQRDMRAHHRRSSDALSSTSTARPRRRSSGYQLSLTLGLGGHKGKGTTASSIISVSTSASATSLSPPPSAASSVTFGSVTPVGQADGAPAKRPLTEEEKAARWEDLLERSAQAGGTLHIAGGARVLASDRLRFGRKK